MADSLSAKISQLESTNDDLFREIIQQREIINSLRVAKIVKESENSNNINPFTLILLILLGMAVGISISGCRLSYIAQDLQPHPIQFSPHDKEIINALRPTIRDMNNRISELSQRTLGFYAKQALGDVWSLAISLNRFSIILATLWVLGLFLIWLSPERSRDNFPDY